MIVKRYKKKTTVINEITNILLKKLFSEKIKENKKLRSVEAVYSHDWIGLNVYINGVYERSEISIIVDVCKKVFKQINNLIAIDVGANIGNHSIQFADEFESVFSFEANPKTYKLLEFNSEKQTNIKCVCAAVGENAGVISIYENSTNLGATSAINFDETQNEYKVNVIKLDNFNFGKGRIGLIKIDVEGMEFDVIKGSSLLINKYRPIIAFEQNEKEFNQADNKSPSIELLKSLNYSILWLNNGDFATKGKIGIFKKIIKILISRSVTIELVSDDVIPIKSHNILLAIPSEEFDLNFAKN